MPCFGVEQCVVDVYQTIRQSRLLPTKRRKYEVGEAAVRPGVDEGTDRKPIPASSGDPEDGGRRMSPFGRLFRFIAWWFGFTGLYSMFSVCPFCGQQGCPVGLASAGTVGAFLTLCVQDWKRLFVFLRRKLSRRTEDATESRRTGEG